MKRILVINNNLHIGGVQKALINLLWQLRGKCDVTLLLFYKGGEYLKEIPPEVKVITPNSGYRYLGMTGADAVSLRDRLGRGFFAAISRLFGRKYAISLMALGQKKLTGFDAAISYLHDSKDKAFYGGCNDFVLRHVEAEKKITFLHCDYRLCGAETPDNAMRYGRFDTIAACSQGCADSFLAANPKLADRVRVVYNCHRTDRILLDAREAAVILPRDRINLVTVARLGAEKAVPRAIDALAVLGETMSGYHYYIIGDGAQRKQLEERISTLDLTDKITLLGAMENPYGYIQAADLLLIPSVSEAAPMVIGEAARLGTPILTTRTSSAEEMVSVPGIGWVCDNSTEGIARGLRTLLNSPESLEEKNKQLSGMLPEDREALEGFLRLLDEK